MSPNDKQRLRQIAAVNLVLDERKRQDAKWGAQNHDWYFWNSIIGEEFGEMCQAANDGQRPEYKTELVQLVALGLAAIENCLSKEAGETKISELLAPLGERGAPIGDDISA